ncbi:MAG: hypothetical protein ACTHLT_20565 [Devosia sp.]
MAEFDAFDVDGVLGHWAVYREPLTGPADDPLYNPLNHLDRIKVHSALAYLQVAVEFEVTITHAAVTASRGWDWSTFSNQWYPEDYTVDRLLGAHGQPAAPMCLLRSGQGIVDPGMPVQTNGSGGLRYLDLYCTDTEVRLKERVDSGTGTLPAVTRTYSVMVLKEPAPVSDDVFLAESGRVRGSLGRFDSDFHYLRAVAAGESPYFLSASQQLDTAGGICKYLDALGNAAYDFYLSTPYTGSLSSITSVQVQR